MTTIVAIRAKDGLVMCSDLQETGRFREYTSKLRPIGSNELLGCAGYSSYIAILYDHVKEAIEKRGDSDYHAALNAGIHSFSMYLAGKIETEGLERFYRPQELEEFYPQGIFAVAESEDSYRIFEFDAPHPCTEVITGIRDRAAKGTGANTATVLLKTAEDFLRQSRIEQKWRRFSTTVIRQFCQILVERVAELDPYSAGVDIQVLTPSGCRGITEADPVFPKYLKPYKTHLAELTETALSDLSSGMLAYSIEQWGLVELLAKWGLRLG
jgi:hypothetical protein